MLLELEDAGSSTTIEFDIEASRISRGGGRFEQIPAEQFELSLGDVRDGRVVHRIELPSLDAGRVNEDSVQLQVMSPEASFDQTLEYADRGAGKPGDYYYVRVTQIDGERAWSSPFWVGGEARD